MVVRFDAIAMQLQLRAEVSDLVEQLQDKGQLTCVSSSREVPSGFHFSSYLKI
jgi:hypothetical protein